MGDGTGVGRFQRHVKRVKLVHVNHDHTVGWFWSNRNRIVNIFAAPARRITCSDRRHRTTNRAQQPRTASVHEHEGSGDIHVASTDAGAAKRLNSNFDDPANPIVNIDTRTEAPTTKKHHARVANPSGGVAISSGKTSVAVSSSLCPPPESASACARVQGHTFLFNNSNNHITTIIDGCGGERTSQQAHARDTNAGVDQSRGPP